MLIYLAISIWKVWHFNCIVLRHIGNDLTVVGITEIQRGLDRENATFIRSDYGIDVYIKWV